MKRIFLTLGGLALVPAVATAQNQPGRTPVAAPAATAPTAGAAIFDPAGVQVGTVDSVTPQAVVVTVGTSKIAVPPTAIGPGAKGLTVTLTKAQLDTAVQQQQAQASAVLATRLVAGTSVKGTGGATLGTVKASDGQTVTITTARGVDVKLPVSGFGPGPANDVVLGMTAQELDAATAGATPQSAPAASATGSADAAATTAPTPATTPAAATAPKPKKK